MSHRNPCPLVLLEIACILLASCGRSDAPPSDASHGPPPEEPARAAGGEQGHEHAEDPLGTARIGDLDVELAQGHGAVAPGEEGHLVVKLPYSDGGSTVVRAWIGTEERTRSYVGKGEYAPSHDDYDVHATAPDPLPDDVRWWIEIEKPDGTKVVGSARPILE